MAATRPFVQRYPLTSYFALAFGLSWGGVMLVIAGGPVPAPAADADRLFPYVYLAMLVGPSVAGLVMTSLVHGRAGWRDLGSRLIAWRVSGRWYAIALMAAPLVSMTTWLALSLISPAYVASIFSGTGLFLRALFGVAVGLGAGFFEELGWTGFAVPHLLRRAGVLRAGVTVGLLWGVWHMLAELWGGAKAFGTLPPLLFAIIDPLTVLPVFRLLMVWVYDRTGSLLVAMLMHASLTATLIVLSPALTGAMLLGSSLALAMVYWGIVSAIAAANHWHLARRRLAGQSA